MTIIVLLLLNSFFIIGLNKASYIEWTTNSPNRITKESLNKEMIDKEYSMILWQLQYYSIKFFGLKWSKPIITCPSCMASVHSILFYWFIGAEICPELYSYCGEIILLNYVLYIFTLCGLNTFLTQLNNHN